MLREFKAGPVIDRIDLVVLRTTKPLLRDRFRSPDGQKAQRICKLYWEVLDFDIIRPPRQLPWLIFLVEPLRCMGGER